MLEPTQILEVPRMLTDKISRRLIFATEGLTIEKPFSFDTAMFIPAEEILAIRLGMKWKRGLWLFTVKQYIIELKHSDSSITRLNLSSFCGIRGQIYEEAWCDTASCLFRFYLATQVNMYLELLELKQPFELLGVTFHTDGISWGNNAIVPWKQIALSNHESYFIIHHSRNPRLSKSFTFLKHWNARILQTMLKHVVQEHQPMFSR